MNLNRDEESNSETNVSNVERVYIFFFLNFTFSNYSKDVSQVNIIGNDTSICYLKWKFQVEALFHFKIFIEFAVFLEYTDGKRKSSLGF